MTDEYLSSTRAEFSPDVKYSESESVLRASEFAVNWQIIKDYRSPQRGNRLLDFGCSFGDFRTLVLKDGFQPNHVELINQAAQQSLKKWGDGSKVHVGSLEDAPFEKGEFQYITSFETLEYLRDPIKVLSQMKELLSEDGILAISVPPADYFLFKSLFYRKQPLSELIRRLMQGGRVLCHNHIYTFSINSAKRILERSGFLPIIVKAIGWRGGIGRIGIPIARLLKLVSAGRIAFTPSMFVIGRKA